MEIIDALFLGVIQGITEFLPVSSSGHLEIGKALFNVEHADNTTFSIIVHCATVLSTIVVFRKDLWLIIKDTIKFEMNESVEFFIKICISIIPVGIIGLFFKDYVDALFNSNLILVGSMLILTAALLMLTSFISKNVGGEVTYFKAMIIGIAQAIAVLPGLSRSGATISTSLLLGVDKTKATKFSFLMVIIPIMGAALLEFKNVSSIEDIHKLGTIPLTVAFLSSFITGLFACKFMINIVKKAKLSYFAVYCLIAGVVALIMGL